MYTLGDWHSAIVNPAGQQLLNLPGWRWDSILTRRIVYSPSLISIILIHISSEDGKVTMEVYEKPSVLEHKSSKFFFEFGVKKPRYAQINLVIRKININDLNVEQLSRIT